MAQLVEAPRQKTGGPGLIPGVSPWKFLSTLSFLFELGGSGVHSASSRNESKVRPACRTDNTAILVVTNVNVRTESQHFTTLLSHHNSITGKFTLFRRVRKIAESDY